MDISKYQNILVGLDNGHAETTKGKRSPYSGYGTLPELPFREFEFNREIVARLADRLKEYGITVFIVTPEWSKDVSLSTRYRRMNNEMEIQKKAHSLFISIHANAFGNGISWNSSNGWCCYTTKGQNNSDKLAECLYDAAEEILSEYGRKIRVDERDGDRDFEENFTVIYGTKCPSVLTENLFYTNIEDTEFLLSEDGKDAIVELHVRGILKYIEKYC